MKTKQVIVVCGLLLFSVALIVGFFVRNAVVKNSPPPPITVQLPCATPTAGCTATIGKQTLSVSLVGALKPLQPFQVWVKAPGARKVEASFTMADMNMGLNQYKLTSNTGGVFQATVTLPVCISGRSEWVMTLDIDETLRVSMPFGFRD
jgi:hypothetical protein